MNFPAFKDSTNASDMFISLSHLVGMSGRMSEATLDSKGRIMLPKTFREALGLEAGGRVRLYHRGNSIIVTPPVKPEEFMEKMKGCIKEGSAIPKVDPLELKRIWEPR